MSLGVSVPNGPVPSLMVMPLPVAGLVLFPGGRSQRSQRWRAALIVRLYVPLATTPLASVTLSWMSLDVPLAMGVPLIVIVLPLKLAVRPFGDQHLRQRAERARCRR